MDILKYTSDDLSDDELAYLIKHRKSFQVVGVRNIASVVNKLESTIEILGYRCRAYSEYSSALMIRALIPTGVTTIAGWGQQLELLFITYLHLIPTLKLPRISFKGPLQ
ncbi:hypothetical protein LPW36_04050 [Jinshanibacter sp. LJY008]|uniref:Uncharacterized protein n=1 Tax=Limnobaculum eriocheiris TaxID=2897391 RepID=A0A9X1MTD0_9GAMM|nr:hypothetical protein [Limnobaculum eriocheiris]MCD1125206.1 hypothetical protein [Limnobaculum eriocheiris]